MKTIDCNNVRREIEEAANGEILTAPARDHLRNCGGCANFAAEQRQLKEMVASLGTVEAPADFDFKLRARLAASRASRKGVFSGNGFGMRAVAFATLILLFGFVVVVMNVRSRSNESAPVAQAPASATRGQTAPVNHKVLAEGTPAPTELAAVPPASDPVSTNVQESGPAPKLSKRGGSSVSQYVARNGQVRTTDLSASAAPIFRPERGTGSTAFPLGTSYQSLKVSVDDGRGSSRTISLPTVSFGSSQVLARNPAPVMVSARDSW